ncbi:MAG TPA: hypothetical protein VHW96_09670 [Solirubrobacteraceae bacterium]|jgi:hypothetical protein|nr:hypothetical protein [Solirubrobacteraceae bacterium]
MDARGVEIWRRLACALIGAAVLGWCSTAGAASIGGRLHVGKSGPRPVLGIGGPLPLPLLQLARTEGVQVFRSDALWSDAQPRQGQPYDWSAADATAQLLAAAGIRWHVIVGGAPSWAGPLGKGAAGVFPDQKHIPQFAAFAVAVAKRYHPAYLEVGNEPEGAYMVSNYPTPAQYEAIFHAVRVAVKRAVPKMKVLMAGMAQQNYADAFYKLAGSQISDGVNIHTYTCPTQMLNWGVDVSAETGYPIVDSEYSWTADGSTPICRGYRGTRFYRAAQTWVLRIPHLELAEPFVWTGDSSELASQIRALAPPR